ncbi:MAG: S1C family serine protease [Lachnospiraceae bacterium]|nr:S1C family serine protease [Lachnospiraceae bacterium]
MNQDSEFLKEKLKQRPLNRKKLLRRMLITILMAVLFGAVASATFLLLEPYISEYLYTEEESPPELIVFPEDVYEDEILPIDMIADEKEMQELQHSQEVNDEPGITIDDDHIRAIAAEMLGINTVGVDDYLVINAEMLMVAREARRSLVTVTGLISDINWINLAFETRGQTTGVIVGETRQEILILANISTIRNADSLVLTFMNNKQYTAEIKRFDRETGLGILSLRRAELDEDTEQMLQVIELGNSSSLLVTGIPVIAVGRVVGNSDSISYGHITSSGTPLYMVDAAYKLLTTNIYGNTNASGIVINMRGQLLGVIDNSNNTIEARNIVSAIGISELKKLIENMCNDIGKPFLGIVGTDVTSEANEILGVPYGAYITEVRVDTPAMESGLRSGDVIVRIGEVNINSFAAFHSALFEYLPEDTVTLMVMRQGVDGFREFVAEVVTWQPEQ